MGGMMGGGDQGGTVVGGPAPWAAKAAGEMMSNAASAAAEAAKDQTNMAIREIRHQYNNAFMNLKPYTMSGIQALDELHAFMGMDAYDPGTAPVAPVKPTIESIMKDISMGEVRRTVRDNMQPVSNAAGQNFGNYGYTGPGSEFMGAPIQSVAGTWTEGWGGIPGEATMAGGNVNAFINAPGYADKIRRSLAEERLPDAMKDYESLMPNYNQQMDIYNYAKKLQGEYAGPLTPEQVAEKLASTPGYQFTQGQGIQAIERAAGSRGLLQSGRLIKGIADYTSGLAQQTYGDHLSRLSQLVAGGQSAATTLAGGAMQTGQSIAGARMNLGDTIANSLLAGANAKAQALMAGNQEYKTVGGGGGGGAAGIGSLLSGIGSLAGAFM